MSKSKVNLNALGNSHDRLNQHQAKPSMGVVSVNRSGGSQVSRPGEIPAGRPRLAGKKMNKNQQRAHNYNTRSENGQANAKGGN